jgi:hypothetical protein
MFGAKHVGNGQSFSVLLFCILGGGRSLYQWWEPMVSLGFKCTYMNKSKIIEVNVKEM